MVLGRAWVHAWADECIVGPPVSGSVKVRVSCGEFWLAVATIMLGMVAVNSYLVASEVLYGGRLSAAALVDCLYERCEIGVN